MTAEGERQILHLLGTKYAHALDAKLLEARLERVLDAEIIPQLERAFPLTEEHSQAIPLFNNYSTSRLEEAVSIRKTISTYKQSRHFWLDIACPVLTFLILLATGSLLLTVLKAVLPH
ncbi:MAG: hypothetical protein HY211_07005 [Candidatus Omnitrophica bacterium]|nr:hypothetical protein [Candidatus Omnitrophota bacterium]